MNNLFRRADTDILVVHSDDERHQHQKKVVHVVTTLLWLTGAAVVAIGTYVNIDSAETNTLLSFVVFYTVNILLVLSGCLVVVFSLIGCFVFNRRIILCLFSYISVLVFVLQCIVAAVSFVWMNEVENYVTKELVEFVKEGYDHSTRGKARFAALDSVQSKMGCCGAWNSSDWKTSNWVTSPSIPYSCCKVNIKAEDCNLDKQQNVHSKGCLEIIVGNYYKDFLVMGVVSVAISLLQLFCFHAINYVMFSLE